MTFEVYCFAPTPSGNASRAQTRAAYGRSESCRADGREVPLLLEMKIGNVGPNRTREPEEKPITLAEAGIDKHLAQRARAARFLARLRAAYPWWLGDWWAYGEARYGERKAIVEFEDWEGPSFQTCVNASNVAKRFEINRRRLNLTLATMPKSPRSGPRKPTRC